MALKITKVKPMFTGILTTMNKYSEDEMIGSIIDSSKAKGTLKEYQKVLAVGSCVRDINVGDMVAINPARYAQVNHKHNPNSLANDIQKDTTTISYSFDVVNVNGEDCLLLQDRDVMYVFEGEEVEEPAKPTIVIPEKTIII